jgi:hypothetical protein
MSTPPPGRPPEHPEAATSLDFAPPAPPVPPPPVVFSNRAPPPAGTVYVTRRTTPLAVASLVLSLVWIFWIGSALAVLFGVMALGKIRESGNTVGGYGLAWAGIIIGGLSLVPLALIFLAALGASSS